MKAETRIRKDEVIVENACKAVLNGLSSITIWDFPSSNVQEVHIDSSLCFGITLKSGYRVFFKREKRSRNFVVSRCGASDSDFAWACLSKDEKWVPIKHFDDKIPKNALRIPVFGLERVTEEIAS